MIKSFIHTCLISLFLFICLNEPKAHELPPGFALLQIADGLDPVNMTLAPDGRLFFTEKNGRVRIVENGQVLLDPFIEIEVDNLNERGLSGIAVDPDFENSPYVYLYYTVPNANHNRLSRFLAEGNFAVPNSEEVLMEFDEMAGNNHNAGALTFANDGTLFVAVGDGKKIEAAQELTSLLGKILRINKDGSIPVDNPFYSEAHGKYRSIWALGHRNPFAMFYESATERLFTTDVGSHRSEELNEIFSGKNYGWPLLEGNHQDQTPPTDYQSPILFYDHDFGCAAVGITTYQADELIFPQTYWDKLFFTDYCNGKIMTLDETTGEVEDFATEINRPLNLLVHPDGSMYFMARAGFGDGSVEDNTSSPNGSLWRIFYTGNDAPFIAVQPQDKLVSINEDAAFEISVSGAAPMEFKWQIDGLNSGATDAPSFVFENAQLADDGKEIRCIITNSEGSDTTETAILHVTANQRPSLVINTPEVGYLYKAGDTLFFDGIAIDLEDGQLTPDSYTWKIDFHHDQHTHPAFGPISGVSDGYFIIPKIGEVSDNVWFRINFSATDNDGLSKTIQQIVLPQKVDITIKTDPPSLPVISNTSSSNTPYILKSVVGVVHDFGVPTTAVTSDSVYVFKKWNTGVLTSDFQLEAPDDDFTLVAEYEAIQALSEGQGLTATYYKDELKNFTFQEPFIFKRIDPEINFEWGLGTPDATYLEEDYFLVKWEGFIRPLVTDTFTFHLITNDGSRLWINNENIISAWFGQGTNEYSGKIFLEEGQFYPIRYDFFEAIGDATAQLLWSSSQIERNIVPSSQLFPAIPVPPFEGEQIEATLFPNPVSDLLKIQWGSPDESSVVIKVFDASGRLMLSEETTVNKGYSESTLDLSFLANGLYFVSLGGELINESFEILKHKK